MSISHAADSIGLKEIPRYEVKIIEEDDWMKGAQALEPATLVPLQLLKSSGTKCIMLHDTSFFQHNQLQRANVVTVVKCESKDSSEDNIELQAKGPKLEIGSPIIFTEASKMIKTVASVPCLRVNSGLVKPGILIITSLKKNIVTGVYLILFKCFYSSYLQVKLSGSISSQYLTALLMAAPLALSDVEIEIIDKMISIPYVDMTLKLMERFRVHVEHSGNWDRFLVHGGQKYKSPGNAFVEGDASSASYFLAGAAVTGGTITVVGCGTSSLQNHPAGLNLLSPVRRCQD
nr:pentafunctional AROM polypeptide-like [Arachis hypogaea]